MVPRRLLTTKLQAPFARKGVVRSRLLRALDEGVKGRLTLLSAPAGYGKSTLLANWLEHTDKAVAWLSLDEGDNDTRRFLGYLVAALQMVDETLNDHDIATDDAGAVMTTILNDVFYNEEDIVLVLDDYHLIYSEAVHGAVSFLLEHAPPPFHLVIGSRTEPPLSLPRLRARGELCELRADDLRFSPEEARAFLAEVMNLALAPRDADELERRTEGWIAGLQLAALSLQGRENVSDFIERFTGTDRFVLDYLTEEVLTRQTDERQNFLVLCSVLERLCGALCDAVTGLARGQARLESLERDNLFIIPLDNTRTWYRLHAFFRDLLERRLEEARPDLIPTLHGRASAWFEKEGYPADALRHALLGEDYARAAKLIEAHARAGVIKGELTAFLQPEDSAQPLAVLLEQAVAKGVSLEQKGRLFAAFEDPVAVRKDRLEPLSERELEVLRLISAGLSNKAIAKRLNISLNTVKTHTKSINGKLGVKSRTQASARAQDIGLV